MAYLSHSGETCVSRKERGKRTAITIVIILPLCPRLNRSVIGRVRDLDLRLLKKTLIF